MTVKLTVNRQEVNVEAPDDTPLLWVLRDYLNLTGTKYGCGMAQCGACTVHLNGQAIRSCVTPVASASGQEITTIEGLDTNSGNALKASWETLQVVQCGYCQPGQIMSAAALLESNPAPDDDAINSAMSGNICRCATYTRIRSGIKQAAIELKQQKS